MYIEIYSMDRKGCQEELVGVTRLERATSCTPCKRSSHLNYTPWYVL